MRSLIKTSFQRPVGELCGHTNQRCFGFGSSQQPPTSLRKVKTEFYKLSKILLSSRSLSTQSTPPWFSADNQKPGEALAQYSTDITQLAIDGKLDPVIGRHEEVRRVLQILARRSKNNPVLIGEPGMLFHNV